LTTERLPASLEASALIRRAEAAGDFAMVLRRGDEDRGALLLVIGRRGQHVACLERVLSMDHGYRWRAVGPAAGASSADVGEFLAKRQRIDPDSWLIELDVAQPERVIAETTGEG
jgi:hypothetical protein